MSFKPGRILIFGGTGAIGRHITSQILRADLPLTQVSVFTSPSKSPAKETLLKSFEVSPQARVIVGDVKSADDVKSAYASTDTVISCLGRGALGQQLDLLRWAEESESVKWFFPSEYGTDIEYGPQSKDEKTHQLKLQVRKFIRDELRKVKCTFVVTGPYPEMFMDAKPGWEVLGGFDVKHQQAYLLGDGEGRVGFTAMPDVGRAVVAALRLPDVAMGQILKVQSFVTTPNAILKEIERRTGQKWAATYTDMERLRAIEKAAWDNRDSQAALATLRRIWTEGGTLYDEVDNGKLGLVTEGTLESVVREHLAGEKSYEA